MLPSARRVTCFGCGTGAPKLSLQLRTPSHSSRLRTPPTSLTSMSWPMRKAGMGNTLQHRTVLSTARPWQTMLRENIINMLAMMPFPSLRARWPQR